MLTTTMSDRNMEKKTQDESFVNLERAVESRRRQSRWRWITAGVIILLFLAWQSGPPALHHACRHGALAPLHQGGSRARVPQCPVQPEAKAPKNIWSPHEDDEQIELFAQRLSDAVKIPTMSFDDMDMDPTKDSRFEIFNEMHAYLAKTYPTLHERFPPQKINTYGLLWTIPGRDDSLRPALYLAHQDVVPVPASTLDQWTFPPFSGHYERYADSNKTRGGVVWGRGASDDKSMLTSVLSAFEELLISGWENQRTILIGSGFDEEVSGPRGAASIAEAVKASLPDRGRQTLEFVIDEGGLGVVTQPGGVEVALPAVAEKGYVDIRMVIKTPGGHSSMPPDHTSIGIMSTLLAHLEKHPHEPKLTPANPVLTHLICMADALEKGPPNSKHPILDRQTRKDLQSPRKWGKVARKVAELGTRTERYIVKTSQAIDIILGGVKANALPEQVEAVVNHRIAMESSVDEIKRRFEHLVRPVAEEYGLRVFGFEDDEKLQESVKPGESVLVLSSGRSTEHTPVSPTDSAQFRALASTIRQIFTTESGRRNRLVSPVIMTGNTDSRHFLPLCEHVYRFNANRYSEQSVKHTVDENMDVVATAESASFFHALAQITDAKLE